MNLILELAKVHGCKFVHLTYRSKETGELSKYLLGLGVNLDRAYRRDELVLRLIRPQNMLEEQAKQELLDSIRDSIRLGIGNNPRYTCQGVYGPLFPGCKYHLENKDVFLYGFLIRKEVIEPGVYKDVRSRPLTLVKNAFRKRMKINRIRQFDISYVERIAFQGKVLTLA
jgi:hypothetical protein